MNRGLEKLHAYPFERLRNLLSGITPADLPAIRLAVGEPQHPPPQAAIQALLGRTEQFGKYPTMHGEAALREACAGWLCRRFALDPSAFDPHHHILPLNGTREGLFAIGQCMIDPHRQALVMMPNPLYQIYEGAALLASAEPYYLNCVEQRHFLPDFDAVPEHIWQRCQLIYVCTPDNPSGVVLPQAVLQQLIQYAHRFDFTVVSDECYCEIYRDENNPPAGLLAASQALGNKGHSRCLAFYSLSKRSNLPGLRSGFVAGDQRLLAQFLNYRIYHGCSMPLPIQQASTSAWLDEQHVSENRRLYRQKFARFIEIVGDKMPLHAPATGFYLWPDVGIDSEAFSSSLYLRQNVETLPGAYLGRRINGINPGRTRVRIALVATPEVCEQGAQRLRAFIDDPREIKE